MSSKSAWSPEQTLELAINAARPDRMCHHQMSRPAKSTFPVIRRSNRVLSACFDRSKTRAPPSADFRMRRPTLDDVFLSLTGSRTDPENMP